MGITNQLRETISVTILGEKLLQCSNIYYFMFCGHGSSTFTSMQISLRKEFMAENRKLSINFYLIVIVSLVGGLLKAAFNDGGLKHFKEIVTNAHSLGTIFGYAIGAMLCGFIIAFVINFIFNLFRKEKKHFSYFWVWLFVIIYFIGTLGYAVQQSIQVTPELKQTFNQNCINQAKSSQQYQSLTGDDQQQALQKINDFCGKATDQYFQVYEKCIGEQLNVKACLKQAQYQTCTQVLKQSNDYCQKLADQTTSS